MKDFVLGTWLNKNMKIVEKTVNFDNFNRGFCVLRLSVNKEKFLHSNIFLISVSTTKIEFSDNSNSKLS